MSAKPTREELERKVRQLESELSKCKEQKGASGQKILEDFRGLAERSQDAIYHYDLISQEFLFVNKIALELYGLKEEDKRVPTTKSVLLHIYPEDREKVQKAQRDSIASGYKWGEVEYRFLHADGTIHWMHDRFNVIRDESGKPIAIEGIVRDDTGHKQAEEALRNTRDYLDNLINYANAPIIVWDTERRITRFNNAFEHMTGLSSDEVVGQEMFILFPESSRDESLCKIQRTLNGEYWESVEVPILRKDGDVRTALCNSANIYAGDDVTVIATIAHGQDITYRKRAEEERDKLQAQLSNAMEMAHLGYWEYDVVNDLFTFNDHFYKIFRTTANQVDGYTMSSAEYARRFVHPDDMDVVGEETRKAVESDGSHFSRQLEHRMLYADGTAGYISVRFFIVKDTHGRTVKTYGVNQDITERKRAGEEKLRLEEDLRQAQKLESIGTLAGGIAHDFNNILSSIIGYTELALDDVEKGTLLEDNLQEVFKAGIRARDLVKQILAFARQAEVEIKPIQVSVIARETLKLLHSTIPASIEIRQNIESDSLIMGDSTQVHQIFMNLCTNAAHAMEGRGGSLEVSISDAQIDRNFTDDRIGLKPGDYLKITVSDTGTGVSSEVIDSIFEPYFTTKKPGEGTGIGLAAVHGIVKGYGGEIKVESEVGKGTVFTVYLPVTKKRDISVKYALGALASGNERILLIDDELPIVEMTRLVLERQGYEVTIRTSSVEALELFKQKPNDFDLVITDMTMPNMNGDKLAAELMKIRSDIAVILCTGYSKKISGEAAKEIGIKAFAYKPIVKADLAKTVRKVLDGENE